MHRLLQFTLDLFGQDFPASAAPAPKPRRAPPRRAAPQATAGEDLFAAAPVQCPVSEPQPPGPPAQPIDQAIQPMAFRHPQANREVRLPDGWVAYHFKRARRRSIGFVVGPEGLVVSAPRWVPQTEVDAALAQKGAWILRKLGEARERQSRQANAQVVWVDGAVLPFLGDTLRVQLQPGRSAQAQLQTLDDAASQITGVRHLLLLGLPPQSEPTQMRDAVQAWLMRRARALFIERLDHFAPLLGVQWRKLTLSNAGTRWGSARIDGSIRLNWRLIHFSLPVIDYVVAHELAHLREMNHSAQFWDTVGTVVPDYVQRRQLLKQASLPTWD